jgi:hypothetical protein
LAEEKGEGDDGKDVVLKGTTLSIFRFIFREGKPVGPREIQRDLGLSSVSVATYHLGKLLEWGFIRETEHGYVVDRRMFENVIRIRRLLIPLQVSYVAFFGMALIMLLTLLRPPVAYASYYFSIAVLLIALGLSALEVRRATARKV